MHLHIFLCFHKAFLRRAQKNSKALQKALFLSMGNQKKKGFFLITLACGTCGTRGTCGTCGTRGTRGTCGTCGTCV